MTPSKPTTQQTHTDIPQNFMKNILLIFLMQERGPELRKIKLNNGGKMIIFVVQVSGATSLGGGYQVYYDRQEVNIIHAGSSLQ